MVSVTNVSLRREKSESETVKSAPIFFYLGWGRQGKFYVCSVAEMSSKTFKNRDL